MEQMVAYDAILFPSDDRAPHLVSLMTSVQAGYLNPSPQSSQSSQVALASKVPHPEMYMDYIAEGIGSRAWQYHVSFSYPASRSILELFDPCRN
jgi:hypothetical protein